MQNTAQPMAITPQIRLMASGVVWFLPIPQYFPSKWMSLGSSGLYQTTSSSPTSKGSGFHRSSQRTRSSFPCAKKQTTGWSQVERLPSCLSIMASSFTATTRAFTRTEQRSTRSEKSRCQEMALEKENTERRRGRPISTKNPNQCTENTFFLDLEVLYARTGFCILNKRKGWHLPHLLFAVSGGNYCPQACWPSSSNQDRGLYFRCSEMGGSSFLVLVAHIQQEQWILPLDNMPGCLTYQ